MRAFASAAVLSIAVASFAGASLGTSPEQRNEWALHGLWVQVMGPGVEPAAADVDAMRATARHAAERGVALGAVVPRDDAQVLHAGEVWSVNVGPAVVAAAAPPVPCDAVTAVSFYWQWTGHNLVVDVPAGYHVTWTESLVLPETGWHAAGRHVGTVCVLESGPSFSFIVGNGLFRVDP